MKICYLCPDLGITVDGHKGASSHIRGFVGALTTLGHEVSIITSSPVKEGTLKVPITVIPQPALVDGLDKEVHPRTFRALRHLLYNSEIEKLLKEVVVREKPDLIYERYSPFSVAGSIFARQNGIPHMLEVNAPLADQGKRYRKQALQDASELLEKTAFSQTQFIVTLTHQLRDWLIDIGISPDKICVRPCGVDEKVFSPEGPSLRDRFEGKVVLGFVGSLKPWHDIEILAKSFRELAKDPVYHLIVVGDGPMRKVINALAEELPGRVTVTGAISQEEVPKYIRVMDIALAPYPDLDLFYFSPLKVYEYMAMGKAIVATEIGQLGEVIRHGENGLLVPPSDVQKLVGAVQYLEGNPQLRQAIGSCAFEEVQTCHTWKKRAEAFTGIAEEFLASSQSVLIGNIDEVYQGQREISEPV
ncbi:MAG: Alpha-D-kanosaminyltransferase [Chlamydiae bacterium]|nr:Alpha-D-kanosaminyltransferase [Chlamydiota bacterium]